MGNTTSYYWQSANEPHIEQIKSNTNVMSSLNVSDVKYLQSQTQDHITLKYTSMLKSKPQQKSKRRPTRKSR
jgi:hypothetical protein